tara:strand:+ start:728 stop:1240 length:513 start_codon:yes stop_codon:yes gene_type:complete
MKIYNTNAGFILLSIMFMMSMMFLAGKCPCDDIEKTRCLRYEFYGVQLNHLSMFMVIGLFFPSFFFTSQIAGILWELLEYMADINDDFIQKYIGGCLMLNPGNPNNNPANHVVYRGEEKYLNPIDRLFGIKNSKIHGWHGSVAEVFVNLLGFCVGYVINKGLKLDKKLNT